MHGCLKTVPRPVATLGLPLILPLLPFPLVPVQENPTHHSSAPTTKHRFAFLAIHGWQATAPNFAVWPELPLLALAQVTMCLTSALPTVPPTV